MLPHFCRAFGLTLRSDLALGGTLPAPAGNFDVDIAAGPVPLRADPVEAETLRWSANSREMVLHIPRVGRFHVTDGRRVVYAPLVPGATPGIDQFILGGVLGAVLHQRGKLCLHASCVAIDGAALAMCGKRGVGKSTTAALLCSQGARLLSDDLALFAELDPPQIAPGYPQTKLTGEALARVGRTPAGLRLLDAERGKYALPRAEVFVSEPLPLRAVVVIERGDCLAPAISRLAPAAAVRALLRHTYRRHYVMPSQSQRNFAGWGEVVSRLPVFALTRPAQGDSTAQVLSAIQQAFASTAG